ncbi:unnamed protein product [Psylliodes chrysocephalus]|uniref:Uncharacterized protein n=1 Tax=Psylliodes chrysocephalus TaxID=3402493 RepID=A0A9P0G945_9CUCU|nr:unnamed protein product [Psylliodes chrysocephala]
MSETNNVSEESSDDSSIRFINRKSGPRRRLSFSSDSPDCNSTNPTNTLIGRKRSRNHVKWIRNLQKHNRIKEVVSKKEGALRMKLKNEDHIRLHITFEKRDLIFPFVKNILETLISSHYTRAHNPRRQYLNPDLNIKKVYELYVTECEKENVAPVKEKYYYNVFSTKFNLHFKQPSEDTCQTCDAFQIKIQSSDDEGIKMAKIEKETHLEETERARSQMAADRMATSEKLFVFSFDLEKALAFPKLTTSVAYYKRNLYVYNFGCHEFNKNISHMFVWPETDGSRGSQEISSCLIKSKPYLIQFKCDCNEDTEFQAINIRKSLVGRPHGLKNIDQPLLYPKGRTVTKEKWRDMMDLLKFIPPVKHDYYKNLSTNRNDESSHTADEEDIIYNIAESSQRIMPLT